MDVELVTVGTELLLGFTLDTNAAELARALAEVGVRVARRSSVGDDEAEIRAAVAGSLERTGFVILTGGLGPTSDDVTKRAVAGLFDVPLELDEAYLAEIERRFRSLRRGSVPASNRSQAEVPRGAEVLPNPRGTAPGLWLSGPQGTAVMLPGVPHEMRGLLEEQVLPRVVALLGDRGEVPTTRSRTLRTTGITESGLQDALGALEGDLAPVRLAYLPQGIGVDLRLTVWGLPQAGAERELARAAELLLPALGRHCYGEGESDLAAVVLDRLRARGWTLALAESCTGGMIGARLTAIAGASDVFRGGVICYADESKVRDLGVPAELIRSEGAVSEAVARAMAEGVAQRFGADAAIAITGIAGPGGGSEEKPVGTVWLAVRAGERERAVERRFPGGRRDVRRRSTQAGLDLLRRLVES
ncbi:MAG: competence/damage-inducible protein A [Planctomycetota bacterium]|jgi:nicotinamide-nucleotide amidase